MYRIILVLLLLHTQQVFGQTKSKLAPAELRKPLAIGDRVPAQTIGNHITDVSKKISLSDIRAPLILLDFFNSGCGACLHDLKNLDSLQRKFRGRVKLVSITDEDPQKLKATLAKLKFSLAAVMMLKADSNFLKLFPYNTVPHHVWLDSNYRIKYITMSSNATAENFRAFLNGEQLPFAVKLELENFDETKPLWLEGNGRLYNNLQYYSYIMKKITGYNGNSMHRFSNKEKDAAGFTAVNTSLLSLMKAAWEQYPLQTFENNNRVALEVKDSLPFTAPAEANAYSNWLENHAYCYELHLPYARKDDVFSVMQQDVERFFPYDIKIEKRKMPCLVLVRTSAEDKIRSKGYYERPSRSTNDSIVLNDRPMSEFILSLNNMNNRLKTPFIDETNYADKIDLFLGCWFTDLNKLKKELHQYDLDLIEAERIIDVLVIKDKKEGSH